MAARGKKYSVVPAQVSRAKMHSLLELLCYVRNLGLPTVPPRRLSPCFGRLQLRQACWPSGRERGGLMSPLGSGQKYEEGEGNGRNKYGVYGTRV